MAYTKAASDRGMFDTNFPLQGIFDSAIFDTELAAAIDTILLPAYVHGTGEITVSVHGNEEIIVQ